MPFKSLQGCLPSLAEVLNVNRTTLYERQRALTREGLLEALPGHGRGSGVRATPESFAMLTIGMLASVNLADVGPLARSLSRAISIDSECRLTGAKTLHAALTRIFADESLAKRVSGISVQVNAGRAAIGFDGSHAERDMDLVSLKSALKSRGAKKVKVSPEPTSSIFSMSKPYDAQPQQRLVELKGVRIREEGPQEKGLRVSVSIPRQTIHDLTATARSLLTKDTDQ